MAMVAAELVAGLRVRHNAMAAIVFVAAGAAIVNGERLREAANGLANIAQQERGGLAALELARGRVPADFKLTEQNSGVDYLGLLDAGSYFSAIDAYGSPAHDADRAGVDVGERKGVGRQGVRRRARHPPATRREVPARNVCRAQARHDPYTRLGSA